MKRSCSSPPGHAAVAENLVYPDQFPPKPPHRRSIHFFLASWIGFLLLSLTPPPALALTETFRTNTLTNSWTFTDSACLTAGTGGTSPACTTTSPDYTDAPGNGWLRLTNNNLIQAGSAILDVPSPLASGFDLTFTYTMYGPSLVSPEADGIAVFLLDPSVPSAGSGGENGGGLGYCQMAGGILGIGLDRYGNFTTANFLCGTTGPEPLPVNELAVPIVARPNISVRAGANAVVSGILTPWAYLAGTNVSAAALRTDPAWAYPAVQPCTSGNSCDRTGKRIHISFYPDVSCGGADQYRILVESVTDGTTMANLCIGKADLGVTSTTQVQLGFAASTGGHSQYHEIRDIIVADRVADLSITKTSGSMTYMAAGQTNTYTIVVNNNGPSDADGAVLTDTPSAGLNLSDVACTATGGALCPAAASLTVTAIQSGIAIATLPAGGGLTFTVTGTVPAGTTGNVSNVASITPPASGAANSGVACTAAGSVFVAATGACRATHIQRPAYSGTGASPVPALGDAGKAALALVLLGLGVAAVRVRARR